MINSDILNFFWIVIPFTFVMWMQVRSFIKMKQEKIELLLNGTGLEHPDDSSSNQMDTSKVNFKDLNVT